MIQIDQGGDDNTTILTLAGRFDIQARKSFQMAIQNVQSSGVCHLTLNISQVTFMDSSAIGVLILANRELAKTYTKLSLIAIPGVVLDTLHLMNLGDLIPIRIAGQATMTPALT